MYNKNKYNKIGIAYTILTFLLINAAHATNMSSGPADRSIIPAQTRLTLFTSDAPLTVNSTAGESSTKTVPARTVDTNTRTVDTNTKPGGKSPTKKTPEVKNQQARSQTRLETVAVDSMGLQARLDRIARQRSQYLAAEKALILGKRIEYGLLLSKLKDYPLYPYLVSKDYSNRLKKLSRRKLEKFLEEYGRTIPGYQLRYRWVRLLAKQQRWSMITKVYRPGRSRQQLCLYKTALYKLNRKKQALSNMTWLWLTHRRLPPSCKFIVDRWHASGKLGRNLVWKRISLMFNKRRARNALSLKAYLPAKERYWLSLWYNVHRKPVKISQKSLLQSKHPIANRILVYGIERMARSKPKDAALFWKRNIRKNRFSAYQTMQINHRIGMTYAYRGEYKALKWLARIPEKFANNKLKAWRVRIALAHKKWPEVLYWINKLKSRDYTSPRWTYWRARALEATGKKSLARKLYQRVAKDRSFEGFLAADRIKVPYSFQNRKLYFPKSQLLQTESHPGILRAREFFFLGFIREARREWYYTISKFKELDLRRAAVLAHRWHWHDRAILTLGKSRYRDDLSLRFPLKHRSMVIKRATHSKIEPAWAMAVIRRESAFQVSARSGVGARGLMQLMPRTARYVARKLKIRMRTSHLKRPALNIRLGVSYLKYQLDKFSGNPVLATAAYNAGPHRVTKWLKQRGLRSADIWVETIPYHETREYTRNIMAYIAIYERRMGLKQRRLKYRLKPVSENSIAKTDVNF